MSSLAPAVRAFDQPVPVSTQPSGFVGTDTYRGVTTFVRLLYRF
jgi:hypothetical protein